MFTGPGSADITIFPPGDGASDEDSGDESCNNPDVLPPKQLSAMAEIYTADDHETEDSPMQSDADEPDDKSDEPPARRRRVISQMAPVHFSWSKGDLPAAPTMSGMPLMTHCDAAHLSSENHPLDFLCTFLTDEIVGEIVKYSVLFATQNNNPNYSLSIEEMYVFLGILYLSGYVLLPRKKMFWETADDVRNILVSNAMRRNRFEEITKFLHFCNNEELDGRDKMGKITPLLDVLNTKFIANAPDCKNISVDEAMIPYFGRHGCKQFMRLKPVRFGFKAWVMAQSSGYCIAADLYQGKNPNGTRPGDQGLGESVVLTFCDCLMTSFPGIQFSFYFDNFFTSTKLICSLSEKGMKGTGTARVNRMGKCPIADKKVMQKRERGSYEVYTEENKLISAVAWRDNNVVYTLSNEHGVQPVQYANRYSSKDKKKLQVTQPNVIHKYNKFMGGVDLLDNNISNYRIGIRGKKWYIPIAFWLFDVCMTNAWMLARSKELTLDQLSFRRQCVRALLGKYGQAALCPGPMRYCDRASKPVRTSHGGHITSTGNHRRTCAHCRRNKTPVACRKCDVPLHIHCFEDFHNK